MEDQVGAAPEPQFAVVPDASQFPGSPILLPLIPGGGRLPKNSKITTSWLIIIIFIYLVFLFNEPSHKSPPADWLSAQAFLVLAKLFWGLLGLKLQVEDEMFIVSFGDVLLLAAANKFDSFAAAMDNGLRATLPGVIVGSSSIFICVP